MERVIACDWKQALGNHQRQAQLWATDEPDMLGK